MMFGLMSLAQMLQKQRGRAPFGFRWQSSSVYMPAGAKRNVLHSKVRNPLIAEQMNALYKKWAERKGFTPCFDE